MRSSCRSPRTTFRTPLATIHGFAHTLVRMGDLEQPGGKYVGMIATASRQLAELLDELGLAARIQEGATSRTCSPSNESRVGAGEPGVGRFGQRGRRRSTQGSSP